VDTVYIVRSVELNLIISQAWQETRWLNFYTQIILRNRTVHFLCVSSKSTTIYCLWLHL